MDALDQRAAQKKLLEAGEEVEKKEIVVPGINISMPKAFVKPFDYSLDLLLRKHPTIRHYEKQTDFTEIDPSYHLYPGPKPRLEPKDEICFANVEKSEEDEKLIRSVSKTPGGAFINQCDVPTQELPGNAGIRILATLPTN